MEISRICIFEILCFISSTQIEKKLLRANGHLVAGIGLEEILGDTSIYAAGLQTATIDVNHIHKAKYFVQLSVVLIHLFERNSRSN